MDGNLVITITRRNTSSKMGYLNHLGNKLVSNASTATLFQNISGYGGMFRGAALEKVAINGRSSEPDGLFFNDQANDGMSFLIFPFNFGFVEMSVLHFL